MAGDFERVEQVFRRIIDADKLSGFSETSSMDDVEGWDSLNFLNIVLELESEFGIRIDGLDAAEMTSMPRILEQIKRLTE